MRPPAFIPLSFVLAASACGPAAQTGGAEAAPETVFEEYGVAVRFPAEPAMSTSTYFDFPYTQRDVEVADGSPPSTIYSATQDNIDYSLTVIPVPDKAERGASIMGECIYLTEDSGIDLGVASLTAGAPDRTVYGLHIAVDLRDNQGRLVTSCFYENGILYKLEAHVLPAHGNLDAPEAVEFIKSARFLS